MIGADGIHSTVRRLAFGDAPARPAGAAGLAPRHALPAGGHDLVGDARAPHGGVPDADRAGPRVLLLRRRCRPWSRPVTRAASRAALGGSPEPARAILESIGDVHVSAIEEVALDSLGAGACRAGRRRRARRHLRTWPRVRRWRWRTRWCSRSAWPTVAPIPRALTAFESRRRPRTDWVCAQTHRRDRTRKLPPTARKLILRTIGPRIFRANYAPLLAVP